MRSRRNRSDRRFSVEHLEGRSLLAGGGLGSAALPPGSLNPSFGDGGVATAPAIFGPTSDTASDVAVRQADGKIVVAGTARTFPFQTGFGLARYNANGRLDTTFGNGGTVFTGFGTATVSASAVAVQPDGKIVVAGTFQGFADNTNIEDFVLARYNTDGSLDTTFGSGGEVLTDFGPDTFSSASSIAIAGDGKIVVAGTSSVAGTVVFGVARYNADGSLDQGFGTGGEAIANFSPDWTVFTEHGLALLPDGHVVLSGTVASFTDGFKTAFGLADFNADGSLDQGFGDGGLVTAGFADNNVSTIAGIAVEPGTNAIVVAGTVQDTNGGGDFALARFRSGDGSLDTSFGTGGEVITPPAFGNNSEATDLAIQPGSGAIVVSGTSAGFDSNDIFFQDLTLAKYNADGSLDAHFGAGGMVLADFGDGSRTTGAGVAIQADGKIVAEGTVSFPFGGGTVAGIGVARYLANGNLDPAFGGHGEVVANILGPSSDVAADEVVQPDGKVVVAGTASVFGTDGSIVEEFAVTRFNTNGSIDTTFGNGGSILTNFGVGTNHAVAVTLQANGKILVVGNIQGTINGEFIQDIGVARYTTSGQLDRSFGHGGEVLISFGPDTAATAADVAFRDGGKIVVAGSVSGFDEDDNFFQDLALARLDSFGKLDPSFGIGGEVLTSFGPDEAVSAVGLVLLPKGGVVVAGTATDQETFNNDFALAKYDRDGHLDTSFGTGGEVLTSFGPDTSATPVGVALQADGKIVVAGFTPDQNAFNQFALARYNTNGTLDTSFGVGGEVVTSFGPVASASAVSLAIQPDGEIVVAGSIQDFSDGFVNGIALARYNPDGSLDADFGDGGEVVTDFGPVLFVNAASVAIAPDGEIFVAATVSDQGASKIALVSYIGKKSPSRA